MQIKFAIISFLGIFTICSCDLTLLDPAKRLVADHKLITATSSPIERFYSLGRLAKDSFDSGKFEDARSYALELQKATPNYLGDWNYGNAIQDSNLVLGRLALKDGELADAKRFLLASGKTPGSPQMDSFGPNMSLANDLLQQGQKDVVLQYFNECSKFWDMGKDKLKEWSKNVKQGVTPDFGANMLY